MPCVPNFLSAHCPSQRPNRTLAANSRPTVPYRPTPFQSCCTNALVERERRSLSMAFGWGSICGVKCVLSWANASRELCAHYRSSGFRTSPRSRTSSIHPQTPARAGHGSAKTRVRSRSGCSRSGCSPSGCPCSRRSRSRRGPAARILRRTRRPTAHGPPSGKRSRASDGRPPRSSGPSPAAAFRRAHL